MRIAVIPARGGSKRIPRKNIKPFCGKPMIAWSIEAARASSCFDDIIVSTDDEEIAQVARDYGASTPFMRPESLADDFTGTIPVIAHAVDWYERHRNPVDYACCIYATAPFISSRDIQEGLQLLGSSQASYVISITSFPFPIQRALKKNREGRVEMFEPENFAVRSQDLEEAWHDAGQFYWGGRKAWHTKLPFFNPNTIGLELPRYRVQDIDTLEDWVTAEKMFQATNSESA